MENHKDRPEIKAAGKSGQGTAVRRSATSSVHTFYYAKRLENGGILRIGKDSENIFQILKHTAALIAVLSLFSVLLCGILSRYLTRRLLSPIEVRLFPEEHGFPLTSAFPGLMPVLYEYHLSGHHIPDF